MTDRELIDIARAAGHPFPPADFDFLVRFADMVAAEERESCAKVCEERAGTVSMFATSRDAQIHNNAVRGDAAAIRARGEK